MTKETSQKIKNMGFVCALFVVTIHLQWHEKDYPAMWWAYQSIAQGIARIAVPFFFVVSGYFLSVHFDDAGWWRNEVSKRIKTLLIPFVIWSLISALATTPLSIIADILAHRPFGASVGILNNPMRLFGLDLSKMPSLFPLWYVRCLFLFVLAGCLFKKLLSRLGSRWLILTFVVACAHAYVRGSCLSSDEPFWNGFFAYGVSLGGIFYFSTGIFIGSAKCSWEFPRYSAIVSMAIGVALLVGKVTCAYYEMPMEAALMGSLAIPCLLYATFCFMPVSRWPNWLTACSFPIFLIHPIVLSYLGTLPKRLPMVADWQWTVIQFASGVLIPILIAVLIRRFFPRLAGVLFGGR